VYEIFYKLVVDA